MQNDQMQPCVATLLEAIRPDGVSARRKKLSEVQATNVPGFSAVIKRLSKVFENEETTINNLLDMYHREQKKVGRVLIICSVVFTFFAIELLIVTIF